ncbi:MAG: hypothetical protein E4H39_00250 [Syntrophobacterales bacterium]|nr:MAG: hypothetical protein E4H39_00250 [Syntrophobacterales bacterium]
MSETREMSAIDGEKGSVLAEIIRTPLFKEILNNSLRDIDPARGATAARTLLWEDPQLILSMVSALPLILNWIIEFLGEVGRQTSGKFSPQLMKSYGLAVGGDVNKEALRDCVDTYNRLIKELLNETPELQRAVLAAVKGPIASATGKGINSTVRYINVINREDPMYLQDLLSGVASNVDREEFATASTSLVNAVLDQKPPLFSWGWNLFAGRIKKKFKR